MKRLFLMVLFLGLVSCDLGIEKETTLTVINHSYVEFYFIKWVSFDGITNLFAGTYDGTTTNGQQDTKFVHPGRHQILFTIAYDTDWTNWMTVDLVEINEGDQVVFIFSNETAVININASSNALYTPAP